jgi:hypothetical protein
VGMLVLAVQSARHEHPRTTRVEEPLCPMNCNQLR